VSAPSEIDVAWSVQSGDWPGELPADVAALLAPPVVVSAEVITLVRTPTVMLCRSWGRQTSTRVGPIASAA
jgi:hypothetical protein